MTSGWREPEPWQTTLREDDIRDVHGGDRQTGNIKTTFICLCLLCMVDLSLEDIHMFIMYSGLYSACYSGLYLACYSPFHQIRLDGIQLVTPNGVRHGSTMVISMWQGESEIFTSMEELICNPWTFYSQRDRISVWWSEQMFNRVMKHLKKLIGNR